MRRAVMTVGGTALGVTLLLSLKPHHTTADAASVAAPSHDGGTASAPPPSSHSGGVASAPAAPAGSRSSHAAASGGTAAAPRVVDGETAETRYGPVQVAIHVSGKRITAVDVLQHPTASEHSQEIAAMSLPVLTKEAVAAQSAQIDAVSGASYTSGGYIRSLQSAIDRAGLA